MDGYVFEAGMYDSMAPVGWTDRGINMKDKYT